MHPNMIKAVEQQYKDPIHCCWDLFRSWLGENFGVQPRDCSSLFTTLKEIRSLRNATEEIEKELKLYVISTTFMYCNVIYSIYL